MPTGCGCLLAWAFRREVLAWAEALQFLEEQRLARRVAAEGRWPHTCGRPSMEGSGARTAPALWGPKSGKGAGKEARGHVGKGLDGEPWSRDVSLGSAFPNT